MRKTVGRAVSAEQLDRAMRVFWERGYYGTSIDHLLARTGLHRAAIYGTFGSKRRLFEAVLARYRDTVVGPRFLAPLAGPSARVAQLAELFRGLQGHAVGRRKRAGCLMVNTASEVAPHIPSVARIVSAFLEDLRADLRRACANGRACGELRSDTDPDQIADYLTGAVLGLWALARSPAPRAAIAGYVEGVLDFLERLQPHRAVA